MDRSARISDDGLYRYALGRRWGDGRTVVFVMLNPSTADAEKDDPTIQRCIRFAQRWGFGGLHVLNLYAYRTAHPSELAQAVDPIGPENDRYLLRHVQAHLPMVAAWGAHPLAEPRVRELASRIFIPWKALGITKDGAPKHPLARGRSRVPDDAQLVDWRPSTAVGGSDAARDH